MHRFFASLSLAASLAFAPKLLHAQPKPLTNVHAHNDYEHMRPLLDALDHGFCSVEADVYLVDGELLVAHTRFQVIKGRTLQALYLEPLRERVKKNGGRVFPGGPEFVLLVELKDDWHVSYSALREMLKKYADILTTYHNGVHDSKAINVIITGHRDQQMFDGESVRYAAIDGDLPDLNPDVPADVIPWISSDWSRTFKWRGEGPMPDAELARLKEIVTKAHQQGRRVRFWGAPDKPVFWRAMVVNGVDLINTDDLEGAQKFLLTEEHRAN